MTARNLDNRKRFWSITVGFRVSPEENEKLNQIVAVSGFFIFRIIPVIFSNNAIN